MSAEKRRLSASHSGLGGDEVPRPKSLRRAKEWSDAVEEAYRFQTAGWRDEREYLRAHAFIDRWVDNGRIKKLFRAPPHDGELYYYNRGRECKASDVHRVKLYQY